MICGAAALFGCSRPDPWVEGTDFPRPTLESVPLGTAQAQFEAAFGAPFTQQEHLGGSNPAALMLAGGGQYLPIAPSGTQVDDRILTYVYRTNAQDDAGHRQHAFKTLWVGFRDGKLVYWDYHSNRTDASSTRFNADAVAGLKKGETTLPQAVAQLGQPSTMYWAATLPPSPTPSPAVFPFPYTSTGVRYEMSLDEPGNKQVDTTLILKFDPSGRLKYADLETREHEKEAFPQPFMPVPRTVFIPAPSVHR